MRRIYVLQAGWVVIGDVAHEEETRVFLTGASVIRRWGTTKGLGEIALSGPTKTTVLDACGDVAVPYSSVLFSIDCAKQ